MRLVFALALLLAGCSKSSDVLEDLPNSSLAGAAREDVPETRLEATLARPVTIGEDGPQFAACGTMGVAIMIDDPHMDDDESFAELRAAPFSNAKNLGRLVPRSRVYVCTRSLDQKWLGVVVDVASVPASSDPTMDCGLRRPVEAKRPYDGPCPSGWISSAYIRLIGG